LHHLDNLGSHPILLTTTCERDAARWEGREWVCFGNVCVEYFGVLSGGLAFGSEGDHVCLSNTFASEFTLRLPSPVCEKEATATFTLWQCGPVDLPHHPPHRPPLRSRITLVTSPESPPLGSPSRRLSSWWTDHRSQICMSPRSTRPSNRKNESLS